MDHFNRLCNWYSAQCDGDWEHTYGIKLETLDNPGWTLEIDLSDTELQEKSFAPVHRGDSEEDVSWLHCEVVAGKFEASGGAPDLPEMLETFLQGAGR
jgi:hypothetical protein